MKYCSSIVQSMVRHAHSISQSPRQYKHRPLVAPRNPQRVINIGRFQPSRWSDKAQGDVDIDGRLRQGHPTGLKLDIDAARIARVGLKGNGHGNSRSSSTQTNPNDIDDLALVNVNRLRRLDWLQAAAVVGLNDSQLFQAILDISRQHGIGSSTGIVAVGLIFEGVDETEQAVGFRARLVLGRPQERPGAG